MKMNNIFFIIGASGSGKTTTLNAIERMKLPGLTTLYFDSIGVPSLQEMTEYYGGPEEWQKSKTTEWITRIRDQFLFSTNILFDGQTRPKFIEETCVSENITSYKVILLDCSDEERRRRLFIRGQKELADENMMNWAKYLRKECEQRRYRIIDNTKLNEKETVSQLLEEIKF